MAIWRFDPPFVANARRKKTVKNLSIPDAAMHRGFFLFNDNGRLLDNNPGLLRNKGWLLENKRP